MGNNNNNKTLLWIAILILIICACSRDNSSRPVNFDTYFGLQKFITFTQVLLLIMKRGELEWMKDVDADADAITTVDADSAADSAVDSVAETVAAFG